jgi:hypothetical protein
MKGSSTHPATEIFAQARQGSIAAIIQLLNERLADLGIRTRAVVSEGMLQLLCEAATPEQLNKSTVVERVRRELESISPHHIKRVKINSRIVKEEQLLWLEDINRDPENALLWAETVTLEQPFFIQRWIRDRNLKPAGPIFKDITQPEPSPNSLSSNLIGAASLGVLLLAALWLFREDISGLGNQASADNPLNGSPESIAPESNATDSNAATAEPSRANPSPNSVGSSKPTAGNPSAAPPASDRAADTTPSRVTPAAGNAAGTSAGSATPAAKAPAKPVPTAGASGSSAGNIADAFAEAVRIAEQAGIDGQTADTAAEWLDIAARWQKASDLMSNIPAGQEQSAVAQDRIAVYQANSQSALQKAAALQSKKTP